MAFKFKFRRIVCIIYAFNLTLLLTSNAIAAEQIGFSFNCKILDQQLLEITDGKSSRYNGYTDGSEVGDTFKLNFDSVWGDNSYMLSITTDHKEASSFLKSTMYNFTVEELTDSGLVAWKDENEFIQRISDNVINLKGLKPTQITGRRYYKNDWNLMLRHGAWDAIFIQTVNCLNVSNTLGIMLEKIRAIHK
jgi:hypothetical protein